MTLHNNVDSKKLWWNRCTELTNNTYINLGDRSAQIINRHIKNGIFYVRNFLSLDECDYLIKNSKERISNSTVVDPSTGYFVTDSGRISQGTYFERGASPVVTTIEQRLARLSGLPELNGEGLQILYYKVNGEYRPHYDYFDPAISGSALQLEQGGQRIVTIIMYLNNVENGGGTIFPELDLEFLPEKGAALMFSSITREGALQPQSLHGGSPVTSGVKWIATRWIRENFYI